MDPAQAPARALGQSLVAFGLLSNKELEQALAEHDKGGMPLGEVIVRRGFASRYAIALALGEQSALLLDRQPGIRVGMQSQMDRDDERQDATNAGAAEGSEAESNVVRLAGSVNGHDPEPEEGDQQAGSVARQSAPGGARSRLTRTLEAYLARTAAQLDERGEMLLRRAEELEQQRAQLAVAEAKLEERSRRLSDLDLADKETAAQLDDLLRELAARESELGESRQDCERSQRELVQANAKLGEQEQGLGELRERGVQLEGEVGRLQARLQAAEAALAHREQLLGELEDENGRQSADLAALRAAGEEGAARVAELQEDLERKRSIQSGLEAALQDREREVAELTAVAKGREAELARREAVLAKLQIKLASNAPESSAARLEAGGQQVGAPRAQNPPDPRSPGHLLFVPAVGTYLLVERAGPPPAVGSEVPSAEGGGRRFVVSRLAPSPLPGDSRLCAYLQASG